MDRDKPVDITYQLSSRLTGKGTLFIRWTDTLGRIVEQQSIPVELTDEDRFTFPLDLRRAVAIKNELHVHLSRQGKNRKGDPESKEEDEQIEFVARPPGHKWQDYEIVMWQNYPANLQPALEQLGINAREYKDNRHSLPGFLLDNNMRWYSERIGTDFYSTYHQAWHDRPHNWNLLQAKKLYEKDPPARKSSNATPVFGSCMA